MDWQPIETAPDNDTVLVWDSFLLQVKTAYRMYGSWYLADDYDVNSWQDGPAATHWMPLPPPPTVSTTPALGEE